MRVRGRGDPARTMSLGLMIASQVNMEMNGGTPGRNGYLVEGNREGAGERGMRVYRTHMDTA